MKPTERFDPTFGLIATDEPRGASFARIKDRMHPLLEERVPLSANGSLHKESDLS
jgi:hypothetical protein